MQTFIPGLANGERGLAMLLDVLGNKAKYEKALKSFSEARKASEDAAKEARTLLDAAKAAEADVIKREREADAMAERLAKREAAVSARESKVGKDMAEHKAEVKRITSDLDAREANLTPREKKLAEGEGALHSRVAAMNTAQKEVDSMRADLKARYAALQKTVSQELPHASA